MKRITLVVAAFAIAAVAYAAPDTEPWRKIYEQRQHVVPQKFDKEVQIQFIDAGQINHGGTFPLVKASVVDAGVAFINGELAVTGATSVTTCTLGGQSPSTCTATVRASSKCTCSPVGATAAIAAAGCAVGLSGTTLTVTSANSATNVVNIHCL